MARKQYDLLVGLFALAAIVVLAYMTILFSGGMRKRVGVARAIAHEPKIILYDEPTTGLDPVTGDTINDLIIRARERLAVTSVAVTHDLHSAYKIADRIAMMHEGKIVAVGTPAEIRRLDSPMVKEFIDASGSASFSA